MSAHSLFVHSEDEDDDNQHEAEHTSVYVPEDPASEEFDVNKRPLTHALPSRSTHRQSTATSTSKANVKVNTATTTTAAVATSTFRNNIGTHPTYPNRPKNVTFTASTTQIAHLSDVFQSLLHINNQAIITIKPTGITLYSTYNYSTNVHVTIDPTLFSIFNLSVHNDDDENENENENDDTRVQTTQEEQEQDENLELRLGVDINLIADCFTSVMNTLKFESAVTCYLTYMGDGHPLIIEFEDTFISEKLEFYTFYVDSDDDYTGYSNTNASKSNTSDYNLRIDYEKVIMEIMVKSDVLTNLLQDLYQIGTEVLFIYCAENVLNFISQGPIGVSKLIFPNERTILEKLYLAKETDDHHQYDISQFQFHDFSKILKAVKLSTKSKIVKDANGCFSIQLLCKNFQQTGYLGTLIVINMTEMVHDEIMVESIIKDEQHIDQEKQNEGFASSNNDAATRVTEPILLKSIPDLTHRGNEPLINSFKRSRPKLTNSTVDDKNARKNKSDGPLLKRNRNGEDGMRNNNNQREEGIPLFL